MRRRSFLKGTAGALAATALPSWLGADIIPDDGSARLPLEEVEFDRGVFDANDAQTILVYLTGGMSDAVANLNHLPQIREEDLSLTPYPEGVVTPTKNGFWSEGGGESLERLLEAGALTIFRTCYGGDHASVAHGINQMRYCHGNDRGYESGIVTTLMHLLHRNGVVDESTLFPSVAVDGGFYKLLQDLATERPLIPALRPVTFGRAFDNPYRYPRDDEGRVDLGDYSSNEIFDKADFNRRLNRLAPEHNNYDALADVFNKRKEISDFIEEARHRALPVEYPDTVDGRRFETAMRILTSNPQTRIVTMVGGHSGWDDHSDALTLHRKRAAELFEAVEAAVAHMEQAGIDRINIVIFGDFGRNLNLNSTQGWDHGNNQAVFWIGGKRYLNTDRLGIVGETELQIWLKKARLYNRPKEGTFTFPAYGIAATLYAIYGVRNPEILTGGYGVIDPSETHPEGLGFLKS